MNSPGGSFVVTLSRLDKCYNAATGSSTTRKALMTGDI